MRTRRSLVHSSFTLVYSSWIPTRKPYILAFACALAWWIQTACHIARVSRARLCIDLLLEEISVLRKSRLVSRRRLNVGHISRRRCKHLRVCGGNVSRHLLKLRCALPRKLPQLLLACDLSTPRNIVAALIADAMCCY